MQGMEKEENRNAEQAILKAAEKLFLEKGYAGAKTVEIAKAAGVNHAMLHYYFRTKENLFNIVFQRKIKVLANSVSNVFKQDLPFLEKLKIAIETHFDFLSDNPRLLFFIYSEVVNSSERRKEFREQVYPIVLTVLRQVKEDIYLEVANGVIRPIEPLELLLNMISLNMITFLAYPMISELDSEAEVIKQILQRRKESNVTFILSGIKR